jgi:hypothetical protein
VRVAIDDFGMGYSSLSLLRRLPVDVVKLDRSFLDDVEGDLPGASFVGAVIALAHTAGKSVVLEGIETQAQFDLAAAAGADIVQGFLFAAPLSAEAAAELVARPPPRAEGNVRAAAAFVERVGPVVTEMLADPQKVHLLRLVQRLWRRTRPHVPFREAVDRRALRVADRARHRDLPEMADPGQATTQLVALGAGEMGDTNVRKV